MAASSVLAPGTAPGNSTDVVVAGGATVSIGLYKASGELKSGLSFHIAIKTPGAPLRFATLDNANPLRVISGPGTFVVSRVESAGDSVGVFTDA